MNSFSLLKNLSDSCDEGKKDSLESEHGLADKAEILFPRLTISLSCNGLLFFFLLIVFTLVFLTTIVILNLQEYVPGGDLRALLTNVGPLTEEMAKWYIQEMIASVSALHQLGYTHRDLKPVSSTTFAFSYFH